MTKPLPSRLTDNFSVELYDCVFEHFHDSKETLSKFSLVCQFFLPLCRRYLFFSLNIRPPLAEQILASPHALETVLPHVKSFALGGHWITAAEHQFQAVVPLVQYLNRPERLQLETWGLDGASTVSLSNALSNHYETLSVLDLKYIRFPSYTLLLRFLSQFLKLEQLSLDNVTWNVLDVPIESLTPANIQTPRLPALQKLSIVSCDNTAILSWLFPHLIHEKSSAVSTRLSSLHLPECLPSECLMITALLRSLGPALRTLELGVLPQIFSACGAQSIHDAYLTIDLAGNTNLRKLELRQLSLYQLGPQPQNSLGLVMDPESPYKNLPILLSTVSSPLEVVTLHTWLSEEWHLDWIPWASLAESLSSPSGCLRRMGIRIFGMRETQDVKAWIVNRLGNELVASMLDVSFDE